MALKNADKKSSKKGAKGKKSAKGKGLSAKVYSGLSEKRMKSGTGGLGFQLKIGKTKPCQFLTDPDAMKEIDEHVFKDGGTWHYVPCTEDDCPLCDDDDPDVAKTSYKFLANVWDPTEKQVRVLKGPKTLAQMVARRAKSAGDKFTKRVYELSKNDTTPVSYDLERSDDAANAPKDAKLIDLDEYVNKELERYYGDDMPAGGSKSALDDDEDDADEDEYDEDDLEEMSLKEVQRIAKRMGIKTVNPKTEKKRSQETLIKLIMKAQG